MVVAPGLAADYLPWVLRARGRCPNREACEPAPIPEGYVPSPPEREPRRIRRVHEPSPPAHGRVQSQPAHARILRELGAKAKKEDETKKKEEKPRVVVDVYRGDKHVQETFR